MQSNVSAMRKEEKLTQAQLAKDIGISRRALSSIENGTAVPSVDVALQPARRLNTYVERIFVIDSHMPAISKWDDFSFIDLFAGIGGIRIGFENAGGHCVFSSEFDEDACKTYEARGTLFFEIERILKGKRPSAFEDVPFEFPTPVPKEERLSLEDVLETNVDRKYYVREAIRDSRLERLKDKNYPKPYISHENIAGSVTPHPYSSALRAGASANYILINDERRPTERELLRFQGFPDEFKIVVPYGKIRKQTGNSVPVPVIKAVAAQMIKALKDYEKMRC